jgi:uncharacterized protein YhjY with autotransporter beta-barrel domain
MNPDNWFVTNEMGAEKFKTKSSNNLCLVEANKVFDPNPTFPEPIRRIFRGVIEGEPEGFTLREKLTIGRRFAFGPLAFSPRLGGEVSWTKIDDYEETETPITNGVRPPTDILPTDPASPNTPRLNNETGAALAYDDQEYLSVRSRLGFVAALPIIGDDFAITPYGEAYYIHEFANDQEEIVARFAGDNRGDDATYFSFKTNEPDRDFFEVALGLNVQATAIPVELAVGFRTIVGNDLYDYYQVESGLRIPF